MPAPIQVAILGFSAFERAALVAHFKIVAGRAPGYTMVLDIDDAVFVIADADQSGTTELLRELERIDDAVFVGASAPPEAAAWMMRPIDPANVMRELDRLLHLRDHPSSRPMPLGLPSGPGAPRRAEGDGVVAPARRAGDTPAAFEPAPQQRHRVPAMADLPLRRALLVDDSEIALHYLRRQLEPYDIEVDTACDSTEARSRLAAQAYGIVFLDVDLGEASELDGLMLCQRIKARQIALIGRPPTLVLVSAFHDGVHRARGTLAGADMYLAKPLDPAALERLLAGLGLVRASKAPLAPG